MRAVTIIAPPDLEVGPLLRKFQFVLAVGTAKHDFFPIMFFRVEGGLTNLAEE